jgi:L-2-hydroxycarboxylate dehydrogenase (NAD+)
MSDGRVPVTRLQRFVEEVLVAQGVPADHASITASRLIEADLRGRSGHGLIRLPLYSQRIAAGGYNLEPDIRVLNESPVSALVDGDNGLGQVVMSQAAEIAIEKASVAGLAWVATVNSNHAGAAGIYPAMALRRGLGAMYWAVANGNGMPPWGGREKLLGTNPMAVAFPAGDEVPFQLDIATTVASHGTIKVAALAGTPMPEGWVVDFDGNPRSHRRVQGRRAQHHDRSPGRGHDRSRFRSRCGGLSERPCHPDQHGPIDTRIPTGSLHRCRRLSPENG